jgi:hypothetical protein
VSPAILRELARVLRERFSWGEEQVLLQLKLIASIAEVVAPKAVPVVIHHDRPTTRSWRAPWPDAPTSS